MTTDLPRPVYVRHDDGEWYAGWVEQVRRSEHGWQGFVRYTVAPGSTFVRWVDQGDIRPFEVP